MPIIEPVKISGLRDLRSTLRDMDADAGKKMRLVLNEAAEIIAVDARRKVPVSTGAAKKSVKAQSGQLEAKVIGGSKKVAYYPWLDFGGKTGRSKSVSRRYLPKGRYIYVSYDKHKDDVYDLLNAGLVDLARDAGLRVDP